MKIALRGPSQCQCQVHDKSREIVARVREILTNPEIAERMSPKFAPSRKNENQPTEQSESQSSLKDKYQLESYSSRSQSFLHKFLESEEIEIIGLVAILLVNYTETQAGDEPKLEGIKNYLHSWEHHKRNENRELIPKAIHDSAQCQESDHRKMFIDDLYSIVVRNCKLDKVVCSKLEQLRSRYDISPDADIKWADVFPPFDLEVEDTSTNDTDEAEKISELIREDIDRKRPISIEEFGNLPFGLEPIDDPQLPFANLALRG